MDDLAFYTNKQLLKELLDRRSFVGLIMTTREEVFKQELVDGQEVDFILLSNNNLLPEQVVGILAQAQIQAKQIVESDGVERINKNEELY